MELNRIHNCHALDLFNSLQEKASLIVADPPYGIGYKTSQMGMMPVERGGQFAKTRKPRKQLEHFKDDVIDTSWIAPAYVALKDGGAMYLFTRWDVLHHWHTAAQQAGFKVVQRIVWDKCLFGTGNLDYYGSQTEDILVCVKGDHVLRYAKREGNVWVIGKGNTMSQDGGGKHPTQKPTRLFRKIISYSSDKGDLIIDPFSGSGAACKAAQALGRRFVGCDISPTFAAAAQEWTSQPYTQPMF